MGKIATTIAGLLTATVFTNVHAQQSRTLDDFFFSNAVEAFVGPECEGIPKYRDISDRYDQSFGPYDEVFKRNGGSGGTQEFFIIRKELPAAEQEEYGYTHLCASLQQHEPKEMMRAGESEYLLAVGDGRYRVLEVGESHMAFIGYEDVENKDQPIGYISDLEDVRLLQAEKDVSLPYAVEFMSDGSQNIRSLLSREVYEMCGENFYFTGEHQVLDRCENGTREVVYDLLQEPPSAVVSTVVEEPSLDQFVPKPIDLRTSFSGNE